MGALTGYRVLDLSRILAGPWCGQTLADLGAEVIKIERPGAGDDTRGWGPPWMKGQNAESTGEASYYQSTNRGKLSVALNIASPEGQEMVRALATSCDVLIENYKAGSLAKYGLDYASLAALNPRLVYCSVTGFGQTGPRAAEPGYDFIIQGMGGMMSITGERDDLPGGGPQKVGVAFADLMTGLYSTVAIQAALLSREKTGLGQHIDMALLDVQVATLCNQSQNYLASGKPPGRYGNAHANIVPYQVFRASDRDFIIACGNDSQFVALCDAIGLPELPKDPRFARNADRVSNREEIVAILSRHFLGGLADEWVGRIHPQGVPVGAINSIAQALDEPQILARNMLVNIPHPLKADFVTVGSPIKLSRTPVEYLRPAPMLGEHTDEVLKRQLGLDDERLAELKAQGIIEQLGER
ncbi:MULTISPECIES: CaiB/BaiF CoA transferase family protein [Pseudomonadaceae]|mgnify:FL=1|jgi:crotonobetainyl-CoA:carnitine CoA-transferase CaiB-like acyl-CoA transferase|uniref:L-carnitine dehydrogenase n=9 Tax=Pseudomonadaceae TaxID=135621 RepID=A0A653BCE7_ECTOL|nr:MULTISPECIES: CaiB/BaiF CoA-transferase family protein [Pseudomonadaceae]ERT17843.1 CoA-transferase [Pseudomonas putida SJ3]MBT9570225.1 CoA transferase [Pseudomonas umsongensis]MCH2340060.1 CoA transferase [Pseudomonas sp.]MDP9687667.1 crotonobetainyl-CoA:carnitine CoA-transferase CaiB-like acyl-CoA transferase [Pseudomonas mohnii]OHC70845.1 MAG: CoA-transferase [Pseudomonadales bacterium RIFCSPLOWO2_02_FULL_63_210]CAE6924889.1 Acetyl-CoA:oxalate CoA-transferase [Pseudomonas oleovorans]|tara:strand:- start:20202 stop:21440 length:1239 start_codon:yes stop_codon:yes gene_type:complete